MERKLFQAFDRQRFQQNARLASIISDVESRYARALSDDDLCSFWYKFLEALSDI